MSDPLHEIEIWDIAKIKPYAKNAKKHPPEQIEALKKAITKFGWTQPIIIDAQGVVIIGHGRRLAAIALGRKNVPVIVRRDLTPDECNALRLSDNRVTSTDYDMSMIQDELQDLNLAGFDMGSIGFDEKELEFSLGDLGEMADEKFVEDIGAAVETQKAENAASAAEADDTAAPVADAFGFKRVTIAQSRTIRDLMNKIEATTGLAGAEALITFISEQI